MQVSNFSLNFCFYNSFATNKACGFECSQNKNGRTSKMDVSTTSQIFSWFLEGTRLSVNTQRKLTNYNTYFSPPIHSACTLPKGLPTSQSQKNYNPSHPFFLFVFLHLSSFLSAIENYRASTGLGLRANFCTLFLVRTCLKLPSPGHALRICLRHHFWTGLARLFRTIGIWMLEKNLFF